MPPPRRKSDQPQGCTNFKLRQLLRRVTRHYDLELASVGLKTTQFSRLTSLVNPGSVAPDALARPMRLEASTLTRNLRLLIVRGLAIQGPGSDARGRRIEITPAGRAKQIEGKHHWKNAQLELNRRMGERQAVELHALQTRRIRAQRQSDPSQRASRSVGTAALNWKLMPGWRTADRPILGSADPSLMPLLPDRYNSATTAA